MTRTWIRPAAAVLLTLFATACNRPAETADAPQQPAQGLPEGHPPIGGGSATATNSTAGGVVMETMDAGGYTYARLGASGQEIWVAGPVTALTLGDTVQIVNPMPMGKFTSKALDRTFDDLFFVEGFHRPSDVAGPSAAAHPDASAMRGVIQETMDSGGYTYVRISVNDKDVWLAGPQTVLQEGQTITWGGGMVMRNFTSNTLNRTFDEIYFVNSLSVVDDG